MTTEIDLTILHSPRSYTTHSHIHTGLLVIGTTTPICHRSIGYRNRNPQPLTESVSRLMYLRVYGSRDSSHQTSPSPSLWYLITHSHNTLPTTITYTQVLWFLETLIINNNSPLEGSSDAKGSDFFFFAPVSPSPRPILFTVQFLLQTLPGNTLTVGTKSIPAYRFRTFTVQCHMTSQITGSGKHKRESSVCSMESTKDDSPLKTRFFALRKEIYNRYK